MPEEIEGTVEKLLFSDEQSGYSVVRVRTDTGTVVAVGSIVSVVPGERLLLKGNWEKQTLKVYQTERKYSSYSLTNLSYYLIDLTELF